MLEYIFSLFIEKDLKQQLADYYNKFHTNRKLTEEQKCDCEYVIRNLKASAIGGFKVAIIPIKRLNDVNFVIDYFKEQNLIIEKFTAGSVATIQISGWVK
jgi:hypothetical protein